MTDFLFHGVASYRINLGHYKPSIDGEILDISFEKVDQQFDIKVQKSNLRVELLPTEETDFILYLETDFFDSDQSSAKQWFSDYQSSLFSIFFVRINSLQSDLILKPAKPPEIFPVQSGTFHLVSGSLSGSVLGFYSSSTLSEKLKILGGDFLFLGLNRFMENPRLKILCQQYSFCLQCENSTARYLFFYSLLFQIKGNDRQAKADELIRKTIQEAHHARYENITNQEMALYDTNTNEPVINTSKSETIYTCLRNEIAHKRISRIRHDGFVEIKHLTLEHTERYIREKYVRSLARIVQLAILQLT